MNPDRVLFQLSQQLGQALNAFGATLTAAESCTGGWIAKVITDVPGSSAWFGHGFVTYSNIAKQQMIGVQTSTLAAHGAVSEPVVKEMATGALAMANATFAVAVSGIAGPDGGSADKPVGTVWFGFAAADGRAITRRCHFDGDRDEVRRQAVEFALRTLLEQFLQNT